MSRFCCCCFCSGVQIWLRLPASSSRHPGLSNGVRHASRIKGYRARCSSQLSKWAEIAAAAAGEALQHERCVSILIERITSGEHGGPAKVFNAAQRAFRSLLVNKSSMPALPVHRRIGTIGGSAGVPRLTPRAGARLIMPASGTLWQHSQVRVARILLSRSTTPHP